jgi:hypothetical protein
LTSNMNSVSSLSTLSLGYPIALYTSQIRRAAFDQKKRVS